MPRIYVAIPVPLPGLGEPGAGPHHLTLAFLGEVAAGRVPALLAVLADSVRGTEPFSVVARGLGAFPSAARPRVVWVGIEAGAPALHAVAGAIRTALHAHGFSADPKPFVPHVTVLRVRRTADAARAAALLGRPDPGPLGGADVTGVDVMESLLDPAGAVHRLLRRLPFAADGA